MDQKMMLEQSAAHGDLEPFEDQAEAQKAIQAFVRDLGRLRDDHKIHHLVCLIGTEVGPRDQTGSGEMATGSIAYGASQQIQRMVADAYRRYVIPAIQWAEALKKAVDPTISTPELLAGLGVNRQ